LSAHGVARIFFFQRRILRKCSVLLEIVRLWRAVLDSFDQFRDGFVGLKQVLGAH